MTMPELVNAVDMRKKKEKKAPARSAVYAICTLVFLLHVSVIAWHLSYWF